MDCDNNNLSDINNDYDIDDKMLIRIVSLLTTKMTVTYDSYVCNVDKLI